MVEVGPYAAFETIADALAAYPGGNVTLDLIDGEHLVAEPLRPSGVPNMTIRPAGKTATVICAAGFIEAGPGCDGWAITDVVVRRANGSNSDDGICVDYPRRWLVERCSISGFGGSSIRFRGGIQSTVARNYIIAHDSPGSHGHAGIHFELSSTGDPTTVCRTRQNYVGAGVQYGMLIERANVGCVFDGDAVEYCSVGMRFDTADVDIRSPYTESNQTGIQFHDCSPILYGRLRDEPVLTWASEAGSARYRTRIGRRWLDPGSAIVYGGRAGSVDPTTSPSERWGTGSPEGVVVGVVGSIWHRTDVAPALYVKESGTGNTGWVAK